MAINPAQALLQVILDRWDSRFAPPPEQPLANCRVFHGRGGCYPQLEWCCLDVHHPVVVIILFSEPPVDFLNALQDALVPRMSAVGFTSLLVQRRYQQQSPYAVLWGCLPDNVLARRANLCFRLSLEQQNPGFFLDMEPGRQWLEKHCAGKKVLNLFAYTCAFSVVAQAAGAKEVLNVDLSSKSLTRGRENHRINGQSTTNIGFMATDILKSWSRIRRKGPFDIIIVDPPSFQKGSFVATRDYAKILRRLDQLAAPAARVLACLNAPELDDGFLQSLFAEHCPDWAFVERLPAHPDFPDRDEARQLKLLVYEYRGVAGG